jgi:uncharacterized membrane protein
LERLDGRLRSETMDRFLAALTAAAALGCGLNAGVFFAFSSFVMKALARLQPAQGIAAMQSINVVAVTPAFMGALFGTALACVALTIWALIDWNTAFAPYLLTGGACYLLGTIGPTIAYHVPRNNALAALPPQRAEAAGRWTRYVTGWTRWNHLRAAASLAAAALLTLALRMG